METSATRLSSIGRTVLCNPTAQRCYLSSRRNLPPHHRRPVCFRRRPIAAHAPSTPSPLPRTALGNRRRYGLWVGGRAVSRPTLIHPLPGRQLRQRLDAPHARRVSTVPPYHASDRRTRAARGPPPRPGPVKDTRQEEKRWGDVHAVAPPIAPTAYRRFVAGARWRGRCRATPVAPGGSSRPRSDPSGPVGQHRHFVRTSRSPTARRSRHGGPRCRRLRIAAVATQRFGAGHPLLTLVVRTGDRIARLPFCEDLRPQPHPAPWVLRRCHRSGTLYRPLGPSRNGRAASVPLALPGPHQCPRGGLRRAHGVAQTITATSGGVAGAPLERAGSR